LPEQNHLLFFFSSLGLISSLPGILFPPSFFLLDDLAQDRFLVFLRLWGGGLNLCPYHGVVKTPSFFLHPLKVFLRVTFP